MKKPGNVKATGIWSRKADCPAKLKRWKREFLKFPFQRFFYFQNSTLKAKAYLPLAQSMRIMYNLITKGYGKIPAAARKWEKRKQTLPFYMEKRADHLFRRRKRKTE